MTDALSQREVDRLVECEEVVRTHLQSFIIAGTALSEIRDSRLYRSQYGTFEEYCERQFGLSRSRAYRLIDAVNVVEALSPMGDIPIPTSERQARELSGLSPEVAAEVMQTAAESGEPLTATRIREARQQVAPTAKVTETTKTETYVDTTTGEVVEPQTTNVSPFAVAAQAMRDARSEPWAVLTTKINDDLLALRRWIADRGIKALVDNRDAIAIPGFQENAEGIIANLQALGALGDELQAEITNRSTGLRRVK